MRHETAFIILSHHLQVDKFINDTREIRQMNPAQKARIGFSMLSSATGTYLASGLTEFTAPDLDTRIQHLNGNALGAIAGATIAAGLIGYALAPTLARTSRYACRKLASIGNFFFPKNEENKRRPNKIGLTASTIFATGMLGGPVLARNHNSVPQWLDEHKIINRDTSWELNQYLSNQPQLLYQLEELTARLDDKIKTHQKQVARNLSSLGDLIESPTHQTVDHFRTTLAATIARNAEEDAQYMTLRMNALTNGTPEPNRPTRGNEYGREGMPFGWHGIGLIGTEPLIAHRTEEGISFFLSKTKLYEIKDIHEQWPEYRSDGGFFPARTIMYHSPQAFYSGTVDGSLQRKLSTHGGFGSLDLFTRVRYSAQNPLETARAYFCRLEENPHQKEVHLLTLGTNEHVFGTPIIADTGNSWLIEGDDLGIDTLYYKRNGAVHKRTINGTETLILQGSQEMPFIFANH